MVFWPARPASSIDPARRVDNEITAFEAVCGTRSGTQGEGYMENTGIDASPASGRQRGIWRQRGQWRRARASRHKGLLGGGSRGKAVEGLSTSGQNACPTAPLFCALCVSKPSHTHIQSAIRNHLSMQ